ncbi:MAG: hypothetical protein H7Z38_20885 [Rubrivivax sp.]|nr:hypothetical protein [Pyrinomonadaceae bacterium]
MSSFHETQINGLSLRPLQDVPSPEMYLSLFERLEREAELEREDARKRAHARAWELAKRQGVEPIRDIKELQGDFWPEEESVDEFLASVRATRQQDKVGAEE